jgi:hypothetical protein
MQVHSRSSGVKAGHPPGISFRQLLNTGISGSQGVKICSAACLLRAVSSSGADCPASRAEGIHTGEGDNSPDTRGKRSISPALLEKMVEGSLKAGTRNSRNHETSPHRSFPGREKGAVVRRIIQDNHIWRMVTKRRNCYLQFFRCF